MLDLRATHDRTCVEPPRQTFFQGLKQIPPLSLENVDLTLPRANAKPETPLFSGNLM